MVIKSLIGILTLLVLAACTLPEGKVVTKDAGATRPDGGARKHDAAVDAETQVQSSLETGGKRAAAPSSGGTDTRAAADGGVDGGAELEPNGASCSSSRDCASANCKAGPDKVRRCYGLIGVDKACSGTHDCDGYECIPPTLGAQGGVCVDTSACGEADTCSREYWTASCQLDQACSEGPTSFTQCYKSACMRTRDSSELCANALATVKGLIEVKCCPPGGAYHNDCDTTPQCGCQDGEKCDVVGGNGATTCGPAGAADENEPCVDNTDCRAGFVCTMSGCRRYCEGPDDTTCPGRGGCKPVLIGGKTPAGAFACTRTCDPTSPSTAQGPFAACPSGQRCEPAPDGFSACVATSGEGKQGASCNDGAAARPEVCAPGYVCITGHLYCAAYCKLGADDCEVGSCQPDPVARQYAFDVEIGYCLSP